MTNASQRQEAIMPAKNVIISLIIVFIGLGLIVTGAFGLVVLPAILAAFYFYWRSPNFSWRPIIVIVVVILLLAIGAYAYLLAYAQGWEH
ncbi:MAG: hypothetical protein ABJN34_06885 [Litoreibacter sp.]|uniref:hypothetical protein n=1 Tax=Litoreibacter sp. TaxID=1969459 RepID=UPI0032998EC8